MKQNNQTDKTAKHIGEALQHARIVLHISRDEASDLLRIMPNELTEYERGITKIPTDILSHIFLLGYKMMRLRTLEERYRMQRRIFRKLKQSIADIP